MKTCDYCRRPLATDSRGRCRECGAQHEAEEEPDPTPGYRRYATYAERLRGLGAMLGGCAGIASGIALFKEGR
jgi:hypothetical protein